MNIREMRYCLEVFYTGNLHTAAQNLFISQPALTQQIQRTESELGIQIFNRNTRPITITEEGRHCIDTFQKVVYDYGQLESWITEENNLSHARLSIGIPPIRALQFLPVLLPEFTRQYPMVKISVTEMSSNDLISALERGIIDIALQVHQDSAKRMDFIPLAKEELRLIMASGSKADLLEREAMAKKKRADFALLSEESFILLPKPSNNRRLADELFHRYNIHPHISLESQTMELVISLVSSGMGCGIVTEIALYFTKCNIKPAAYSLSEEIPPYHIGIAVHPDHRRSKVMEVFINFCKEEMQKYPFSVVE